MLVDVRWEQQRLLLKEIASSASAERPLQLTGEDTERLTKAIQVVLHRLESAEHRLRNHRPAFRATDVFLSLAQEMEERCRELERQTGAVLASSRAAASLGKRDAE